MLFRDEPVQVPTVAEVFIANEPYTKGCLFESVTIHRWRQMVPEPEEGFLLKELERQRNLANESLGSPFDPQTQAHSSTEYSNPS